MKTNRIHYSALYCLFCLLSVTMGGWGQYFMHVDTVSAIQQGLTVHRLSVVFADSSDRLSAVYGNDEAMLTIEAPEGVYNSALNTSWNASGINTAFLPIFPELADDTYATVGLTGPASITLDPLDQDPALLEDQYEPISPFFLTNAATSLQVSSFLGSSWFVLNTASNGLAGDDLKVLVMQITSAGPLSGSVPVQIFPQGNGELELRMRFDFDGIGEFEGVILSQDFISGCTDQDACNYNASATVDDGQCLFLDVCGVCGGSGIPEGACNCEGDVVDVCGECGGAGEGCGGCTFQSACNYDPEAGYNDGSCEYESCLGCTNPEACTYDPNATLNNEFLCEYADFGYDCFGACLDDEDGDGVCDFEDDCVGDIDACGECNGPGDVFECGCFPKPEGYCDCAGELLDSDGDGVCDVDEIAGCTDALACNYSEDATDDDGTCKFCTCSTELELVAYLGIKKSVLFGTATDGIYNEYDDLMFDMRVFLPSEEYTVTRVFGNNIRPLSVSTFGVVRNSSTPESYWPAEGDEEPDTYATVGLPEEVFSEGGEQPTFFGDSAGMSFFTGEPFVSLLELNTDVETGWELSPTATNGRDTGNGVQLMAVRLTPIGNVETKIYGWVSVEVMSLQDSSTEQLSFYYDSHVGGISSEPWIYIPTYGRSECVCGDMLACNYNPAGPFVTNLCAYGCAGCTDAFACNYDPDATADDGSLCEYPDLGADCFGECLEDVDEDGLCDLVDDCVGTYDECGVCNGPGAVFECGCSVIPAGDCDCYGNAIPDGECDCNGNVFNPCGECGGFIASDTLSFFSELSGGLTDSASVVTVGTLSDVIFNLNFSGTGGSFPADIMVYLYAPNGECIVWGGWDMNPVGGCTDVGTGFGNSWPDNWFTSVNGFYTHTLPLHAQGLSGEGEWAVIIQNAWNGSNVATYDLDIVFVGLQGEQGPPGEQCNCAGDVWDECGVCGGDGIIPDGECDCNGSVLDAIGVCGGDCVIDQNENGICDLEELENGLCGPESCGLGTVWDEQSQTCIVAYPADTNFDGCVQLNDLLDLLTSYGLCQVVEAPFSCGDPVSYQGYDYATVLICEQCWFAENLRSENYDNGDAIPSGLSDSEWGSTTSGAVGVYGEDAGCQDLSPDIDACDPAQSLNEYGRLYNWYAVDDVRGLCPSGWHVPTDGEWTVMTDFLGGASVAGGQMKTTYGWYGGGNGTNSSGFSGLPGGARYLNGVFYDAGDSGYWWSSSPSGSSAWYRRLYYFNGNVSRGNYNLRFGFSVRCVRDAE